MFSAPFAGAWALLVLGIAAALLAGPGASAEPPKIYKWVDQNGIAHYTTDPDRIPKSLRDRIQSIERSRPEAEPPAPAPAETTAVPQPDPEPDPSGEPAATPAEPATAPAPAPAPRATAPAPAPAPRATVAAPTPATVRSGEAWFDRDALPRVRDSSILASGEASPAQLEALAAEQEALDAQIAAVQAEIVRDENFLRGLISDPELDSDVPLFDRPEFLEVSRRLPELQAQLQELRDERAKLETP